MRNLHLTKQFQTDLDNLDNSIKRRVHETIRKIEQNPYQKGTHSEKKVSHGKIMRSRVNDNFRVLWEWLDSGDIALWRVAKHEVIDRIDELPTEHGKNWELYTRDPDDHTALELKNIVASNNLLQPFKHVPDNILRLIGVPDEQLEAVHTLDDAEYIWELAIPENVQLSLYDMLANPNWNLEDLLGTKFLLYRSTVDHLEGYCEGKIKKLLLNLNEEQESYVHINASGPVLIKGVAGSGKTTIGLYRAHYLAKLIAEQGKMFGEGASILLLTYSLTLTKALEQLYRELHGEDLPYTIDVAANKEWMIDRLKHAGLYLNEAERNTRRRLIDVAKAEVARAHPEDRVVCTKFSQFLLDEIDKVIRARRIGSLAEYLAIERIGRGSALDRERHRPIVWDIYQRYQKMLDENGLFDWEDLARLVELHCQPLAKYDVVIVDEAQDLPPSDLHLATLLVRDFSGLRGLTFLADPAQSIYHRGIPWKEAGINIQGRTRILAKNFRNTQQILNAARFIVEGCDDLKEAEEFIPPTSTHRMGQKPVVVGYKNESNAENAIARKIISLCQTGKYRPGDIAILAKYSKQLMKMQRRLSQYDIPCIYFRQDDDIFENRVKLITMHSAKGLEFPIVFMIDLDDDTIPNIFKYSETKEADEMQERKLFYVSMTRAAERLYLLHPQRNRSRFLYDLEVNTINQAELN